MYHEQVLTSVSANVMVYDDLTKKWIPVSSVVSPSLCEVEILHHFENISFKIVARLVQTGEVVLYSSLEKGMRYNEATPIFHQWRDKKIVYGLHFLNRDEAEGFGATVKTSFDVLNSGGQVRITWPNTAENMTDELKENLNNLYDDEEDLYEEFREADIGFYPERLREASRPLLEQSFNRLGSFRSPNRSQPHRLPSQQFVKYPQHSQQCI